MIVTPKQSANGWETALLAANATVQEAIYSLEQSGLQIVLAIADEGRLVGTLTDGDIRRAFLKGCTLDSQIDGIVHRSPLVVPPDMGRDLVLQLMGANKIHQLPVVDPEGKVIGLHVWDSVIAPVSLDNIMVIMAGGKGTRLRPHTEHCPKPMIEVGGKPMLEHIIERAKADGLSNFIISLHYLGEMIETYFGNGSKWGVQVNYLREVEPLGTAGCLSLINEQPDKPIIVTNGDVLTDIHYNDILEFHQRQNATATMAVRQHEIQNQFGVVKVNGVDIAGFEEKPIYRSHINAGIYVLNPETLSQLNKNEICNMPSLFERIKNNTGRTIVFPMHEPWLDVGRPDDLAMAKLYNYRK
jgi:dTDP-glucose pyrophosphorylase